MYNLDEENENSCICPHCGSELTYVDFNSLVFMCPECGEYIEFSRDNKPIMSGVNVITKNEDSK